MAKRRSSNTRRSKSTPVEKVLNLTKPTWDLGPLGHAPGIVEEERTEDVVLGWIYGQGMVHGPFMSSVCGTLLHDRQSGAHRIRSTTDFESSPRIVASKTSMIDHFLGPLMRGTDKLPPRWLMMMDTDMTFESWAVHKLLAVAEHEDIKVIGGLCFAGGLSKMYPTVYSLQRDEHGPYTEVVPDYPRDQLVKVGATGGAFLLVHRDVFLRMLEQHGKLPDGRPNPKPWFVDAEHNGRDLGEDIAFCLRAQALGYGVYVHTGVKVGHIKRYELDEEEWDRRRAGDSKAGHLEVAG